MTTSYTKTDLRCIWVNLSRLLPPGGRPPTAEDIVEINKVLTKTSELLAGDVALTERGRKIFEWRLHAKDAPTQNQINSFAWGSPFMLSSKKKRLDSLLAAIIEETPGALVHGERTKRWVRVTRFSSSKVDDPNAADALGGKLPIDALVRARVLNDDSEAFCRRDAGVRKTKPGNTHVLLEIFEMAEEEVPDPGPVDVVMPPRKPACRGTFTHDVVESAAHVDPSVKPTTLLGTRRRTRRRPVATTEQTKREPGEFTKAILGAGK